MTVFKRTSRYSAISALLALAFVAAGDFGVAADQLPSRRLMERLDGHLRQAVAARRSEPQRVIIRVRPGQRDAIRRLLEGHEDTVLAEHQSLEAMTAVVHGDDLAALAAHDAIVSMSTDAIVRPHGQLLGGLLGGLTQTLVKVVEVAVGTVTGLVGDIVGILHFDPAENTQGPEVPPPVLRETLGLDDRWTGRSVGVAVIDSGLEMSSEFQGRVTAFYNFTGGKTQSTYAFDDYGHGTHVAGIIGGSGALGSSRDYRGIAPNVRFTILKVLDANGAGYTSDVVRAIDFAVANRSKFGIDIINLSLGHPIFEPASTDPLVLAVERASQAGIIVVTAAGNFGKHPETGLPGYAGVTSPGNAPSAITAGAVMTLDTVGRNDDRIPDYSSAGPTWYDALVKPDIVAPGHNIVGVAAKKGQLYKSHPELKAADTDYIRLSGTSMATSVATGIVALMIEAHETTMPGTPPLSPNFTKGALQYSALTVHNDLGVPYDPLRQGAGALNGRGAIQLAKTVDTTRPSGSFWLTQVPSPWTTIAGGTHTWNQGIIWGSGIIWGATVDVNHKAWASGIIWGADVTWGSGIIWGANVVWTNPSVWSTGIIWGADTVGAEDEDSGIIWGSTGTGPDSTVWKNLSEN
jgi:serine protease AprX